MENTPTVNVEQLQEELQIEKDRTDLYRERWVAQLNINEGLELRLKLAERQNAMIAHHLTPLTSGAAMNAALGETPQ